jgi:hypothetical protein
MQLIEDLERRIPQEDSLFRAQLLREDVARLRRLQQLSRQLDRQAFVEQGMRIGWTQGDARTAELREPLQALLEAVYRLEHGEREQEARVDECWHVLHRTRMERLLGCLSPPTPRLAD